MRRLGTAVATAAAAGLLLAGCSSGEATSDEAILADRGLGGMETTELIDHLDRLGGADRPNDLMASVRYDHLLVGDGETELELELPDDQFYLAFAPYVTANHDCFYHSLTTCQGELVEQEIEVMITDSDSGEVLVSETTTTFANGFVSYWLPRDRDVVVDVGHDGLRAAANLSTGEDDPTCVTTLQLT